MTDTIQFPNYKDSFDELLSVWQAKSSGYRIIAKSLLYRLLYHYLIETESHIYHSDTYYKLIPAQEFLDNFYYEEENISALAQLCNLSESHFRRLFSQLYGCSPTEYRKRKRVLHAKDLLLSGVYSIAEISQMVGFSNQNYFARFFKKETGMSPTDFVNQFL
jgi:AraC-like DNA-binding protein